MATDLPSSTEPSFPVSSREEKLYPSSSPSPKEAVPVTAEPVVTRTGAWTATSETVTSGTGTKGVGTTGSGETGAGAFEAATFRLKKSRRRIVMMGVGGWQSV